MALITESVASNCKVNRILIPLFTCGKQRLKPNIFCKWPPWINSAWAPIPLNELPQISVCLLWHEDNPARVELKLFLKLYFILKLAEDYGFFLISSQTFEQAIKKWRPLYVLICTFASGKLFSKSLKIQVCGKQFNIFFLFTVPVCIAAFFSGIYSFCQPHTFKRQFNWFRKWISRFNGLHWSYFKQLIFNIPWAIWDK